MVLDYGEIHPLNLFENGDNKNNSTIGGIGIYHGNKKSHVFHSSGCQYYNCKNCTVVFKSANDAMMVVEYRAHTSCVKRLIQLGVLWKNPKVARNGSF